FRHFNCYDQYIMCLDDITITGAGGDTPVPPTPGANVIGVEIFRDGEWIAEVLSPAQTYTDMTPGDVEEYEIRVVYNGNTDDYSYYTMSCPQVAVPEANECLAPENLTGSYQYFDDGSFGAFINWTYSGEVNAAWYQYDDGNNTDAIGTGGGAFSWGVMFPAGDYAGAAVTKVEAYDYMAMTGTLHVYQGGTTAPETELASMPITFTGSATYATFVFDEPVALDPSQSVWIVFDNESSATYPAACGNDVSNDPNGRWVYIEGAGWLDLADAGVPGSCWNIHTYISDGLSFNIYRDGEIIATMPYVDGDVQTYFDDAPIGNYQYQVTAVSPACESDFALTPDLSQNFVQIDVTSVNEINDTRIYPNPTTGNVTIEAAGMNHISVFNALGQLVYDSNVSSDQMTMNLGQFQAGVYMVRITTENGVSVNRVTVTK
nr:T9SS type A sorting domain-containing protein [Bacteroidales bacterium]